MENASLLQFDDVRIDLRRFEVTKAGAPVRIEPKAYEVLLYLMEHRQRVVEKTELLDTVWKDSFVTENALTRAVAQLRKGLGDSKESQYIATIHKRGYRFVASLTAEQHEPPVPRPSGREIRRRPSARRATVSRNRELAQNAVEIGVVVVGASFRAMPGRIPSVGSVAILPATGAIDDARGPYGVTAITQALVDALAVFPQLTVSARSTMLTCTAREADPNAVGIELGVDAVMTGAMITVDGERFVTTELVDARDGAVLWTERYRVRDRLEENIARDVAGAVHLRLSERDRLALARGRADEPGAYDAYLRGRHHWNSQSVFELRDSVESFERAIAEDAGYAPAFAGLADAYSLLGVAGFVAPREVFSEAKRAALRALALDDQSAEAYTALAAARMNDDWDWDRAASELEHAVELDPEYPNAHVVRSQFFLWLGRLDEAVAEARRACELDPLGVATTMNLGWTFYYARRYEPAAAEFRKALDLFPEFAPALYGLGETYERTGLLAEAIETIRRAKDAAGGYPSSSLAHALGVAGHREAAERETRALVELAGRQYVSPYYVAVAYLGLGDKDLAISWLGQACEERSGTLVSVRANPRFDRLRDDPRFARLLERIGPDPRSDRPARVA